MTPTTTYTDIVTADQWKCGDCGISRGEHHHAFERKRYPFVAMMRIRNEAGWIAEVVRSTFHLCDRVFILDDHSTDATLGIITHLDPRVTVYTSPFEGLNEARDKNWLYDQIIRECAPDWILCIDGDEVLEGSAGEAIRRTIEARPEVSAWALKIEYLWGDRGHVRTDRIYGDFWRPSLFRPMHQDPAKPDSLTLLREFRFQSTPFGRHINSDQPNLHCSSVPQRLLHGFQRIPARIIHYGYMRRQWRVSKLDYYTSIDWNNKAEDGYRHMCQGDNPTLAELPRIRALIENGTLTEADVRPLLDVPATGWFLHAGPLSVAELNEGQPWEMSDWAKAQNYI